MTHNGRRLSYITCQQVIHARPSGNHQRESDHLPTTTDASSKRPTTNSKDHDHRLTTVSPYVQYLDVAAWREAPRWVGWTSLDGHVPRLRLFLIGFEYRNVKYLGKIANVIVTR